MAKFKCRDGDAGQNEQRQEEKVVTKKLPI